MAARALVMYAALLIVVRSGKKRFLGRATAFDIILIIILGSIAARAITGGTAFFAAIGALVVLVFAHWLLSLIARDSTAFGGLIKGHSTVLIRNGKVDHKALRAEHMSADDLDEDLRDKGIDAPTAVEEARLERSGKLSVLKK
jgi:uncharacterized membrane protein YcaP (DUF421 family)